MTKIKICGITRLKEIEFINELQPEYAGFVFAKSRRRVSLEQCVTLSEALDKNIKRVGVFVNEDIENVKKAVKEAGLQVVQLHGDEDQAYIDSLKGVEVWKAISVSKTSDVENAGTYSVQGLVFDSMVDGIRGGTGKSFDWNIIKGFTNSARLILAGGLNSENVGRAIETAAPDIVDVSSGVEQDGLKSFELCRNFIREVRKL